MSPMAMMRAADCASSGGAGPMRASASARAAASGRMGLIEEHRRLAALLDEGGNVLGHQVAADDERLLLFVADPLAEHLIEVLDGQRLHLLPEIPVDASERRQALQVFLVDERARVI